MKEEGTHMQERTQKQEALFSLLEQKGLSAGPLSGNPAVHEHGLYDGQNDGIPAAKCASLAGRSSG